MSEFDDRERGVGKASPPKGRDEAKASERAPSAAPPALSYAERAASIQLSPADRYASAWREQQARLEQSLGRTGIMRKAGGPSTWRPTPLSEVSGNGGGAALPTDVRAKMEGQLGADLSPVKVHTSGASAEAASELGARAFTVGKDVHFGAGEYAPGTKEGDRLLAHELVHTVQGQKPGVHRKDDGAGAHAGAPEVSRPDDPAEKEADQLADHAADALHGHDQEGHAHDAGAATKEGAAPVARKSIDAEVSLAPKPGASAPAPTAAPAAGAAASAPGDIKAELRKALHEKGKGEAQVFARIQRATVAEIESVAHDAALMQELDKDLGAASNKLRAEMAHKLYPVKPLLAFELLAGADAIRHQRLHLFGGIAEQRALCDAVIQTSADGNLVRQAFQSYWSVECTAVAGAKTWPVATLQAIHRQMKLIPAQDTRSGIWKQLELTSDPSLIDRAAWDGKALIVGSHADTTSTITMGYGTKLTAKAAKGAAALEVEEGARLKAGDSITFATNAEVAKIKHVSGHTWTLETPLQKDHPKGDEVTPNDGSAERQVNWLAATVRHEIGHSVDSLLGVKGYTHGLGGWWTGPSFDTWASAMGEPWKTNDGSKISEADKKQIKEVIVDHVTNAKGSLFAARRPKGHALDKYAAKDVPVIVAAEACLSRGDSFYSAPTALHQQNGRRFSVSFWYRQFMYCKEDVLDQRVSDYSLYAPAEFFAESYTVFYEEAGKPGITDADYGRLIRNSTWRSWIRSNIHDRGHAPAGTGAAKSGPGAAPGGGGVGRGSGNPG